MAKISQKIRDLCAHLELHGQHQARDLRQPMGVKCASRLCQRATAMGLVEHDQINAGHDTSIPRRYSTATGWRDKLAAYDARKQKKPMGMVNSVWQLGAM